MSLIITSNEEIEAYYASSDLSQSELKKLLKGIANFKQESENIDDKPNIIIGKAVDMILTGNSSEFENTFYVSNIEKMPSDAVVSIIRRVYDMLEEDYQNYLAQQMTVNDPIVVTEKENLVIDNDSIFEHPVTPAEAIKPFPMFAGQLLNNEDYIIAACEEANYQPRWGREAKLKAIIEPGADYFADLCKAYGKKVIDSTTNNTIQSIVMSLRTNPRTAKYFDRKVLESQENITFIFQMPIYFEYRGINCKALLDLVIVIRDEEGRILFVEGIDLKTMHGNTYDFLNNVKSFRYDIQGAWYSLALIHEYALHNTLDKLLPFKFIVESTTIQGKPLVYTLDKTLLKIGKEGRPAFSYIDMAFVGEENKDVIVVSKAILGYDNLIDLYLFHEEYGWDLEQEIIESDNSNLPLTIDWNGFVSQESLIE